MAFENSAGLGVHNHYGARNSGGTQGVFKTEGYMNEYVVDLDGEAAPLYAYLHPRGDGVRVFEVDTTFVVGTVTAVTIGGVDVTGATRAAPVRLLQANTGEVVVTGATGGKLIIRYKNVAGDSDGVPPAFPEQA